MSKFVNLSKAPKGAEFYAASRFRRSAINTGENPYFWAEEIQKWSEGSAFEELIDSTDFQWLIPVPPEKPQEKANDASVSIANLLNAQVSIAQARKSSEFSEHNAELADQADAILQAIIGNLKVERIPAEASFHLANAQNELSSCAKLLEGDKALADAVFCIGEKLAGIRKGEL